LAGTDNSIVVELGASIKRSVSKNHLANCQPSATAVLAPKQRRILSRWLSARYFRAAFPDAFVNRLNDTGVDKRFKRIVEKAQSHVSGIYFDLDRDEAQDCEREDPDDLYVLSIYLVHPVEPDPEVARKEAEVARALIEALFEERCKENGRWRWVRLEGCYVVATTEMTLEMVEQMRKWHLDYISQAKAPEGPVVDGDKAA